MSELKPCPFCGGEMVVSGSSRLRRFTIGHKNLRNCYFYSFEIDWQTVGSLAEAEEAWNKRTSAQKHGRWIIDNGCVCCSECGEPNMEWNYCPNCGAEMGE